MLVRIRSKDGNFRFELQPNADVSELTNKILETTTNADPATIAISNQPRGNEALLSTLKGRTLGGLGLKHGDLVFVSYKEASKAEEPTPPAPTKAEPSSGTTRVWETVKEDPVDVYWRSQSGMIPRGRDSGFCRHGANGMCDYCRPLEPYDPAYQKEHNIKHLSYHAYLRKITPKPSGSASSSLPPLSPLSYKVKSPCPTGGHAPWPAGICTACQPSAITLQSQPFRMVDHLEIASMEIIDRFLHAWRMTGLQRFGWLIGRYEPYEEVPMGVKAVVEAIYEPPQEGELDGLSLGIPWEEEGLVRELAKSASTPLTIVGYIFTDLDPTPEDRTKNIYKRHPQSFFISCVEAIFAATIQKANPTPSKSSPTGQFASRLVTAVLTATEDGAVDVSAYQVSEQACAMVEADMIEASVDPGIVRVKEEDASRYVPDVFFSYKNEYGLEVKKSAKPAFPVEYLLVNVTHGFPQNPSPMFRSTSFPIENRPGLEDQKVESVLSSLVSFGALEFDNADVQKQQSLAKYLSDFHLIVFLSTTQLLSMEDIKIFIRVASSPKLLDDLSVLGPLLKTDGWQTLVTFAREHAPARPPPGGSHVGGSNMAVDDIPQEILDQIAAEEAANQAQAGVRVCPHCTYENGPVGNDCELCGLPLS